MQRQGGIRDEGGRAGGALAAAIEATAAAAASVGTIPCLDVTARIPHAGNWDRAHCTTAAAGAAGEVLRFSDSFKSYYDRRFCYSRGRAIHVPSLSRVWLPHPATIPIPIPVLIQYFYNYTILQFLGFTFINLRISNRVTIFMPLSRETSHPEHLYEGLALSFSEERSSAF